jgi:hypothetical protein
MIKMLRRMEGWDATVLDKVEAAYQRGDLFDKRRRLMTAWADYITKAPAVGSKATTAIGPGQRASFAV